MAKKLFVSHINSSGSVSDFQTDKGEDGVGKKQVVGLVWVYKALFMLWRTLLIQQKLSPSEEFSSGKA